MSERAPHSPEHSPGSLHELHKRHQEALKESSEKARNSRHEHAEKIETIRLTAEHEATSAKELLKDEQKQERPMHEQPAFINRELKDMAYRRTLKRTQSQLPLPQRTFSRIIHNPAVEAISEIAGKTVARPSGVLAGGICAFIGSSAFLWIARHYGYEYNFLLFALLFVGGFFVGLLIELLLRLVRRPKQQ